VTKRVAIVQSSYVPWKGYFDLINMVDEFVLFDDRQFTRRDWRNRNRIKTAQGTIWLTIPVKVKGKYLQRIDETVVDGWRWREQHWKTLVQSYAAAPFFGEYAEAFRPLYLEEHEERLSAINRAFLERACEILGIKTTLGWSTDYMSEGARTERLVSICVQAGATSYLSGPSARAYLDERLFREHGIDVEYMSYDGYPEYAQLHPPYQHAVSILDLIFNTGPAAPSYMKSFG
jgi:WbqC-like protein